MPGEFPLTASEQGLLYTALEAGRYSFFIGAGVSSEAGLPTARQLVDTLLRHLYRHGLTTKDAEDSFREEYAFDGALTLGRVTQAIQDKMGRSKLIALLQDSVNFDVSPGFVHGSLAKLSLSASQADRPLRVITPNYDALLEDAFGRACDVVATNDHYRSAHDGRPWVVKIHGCIRQEPQTTIIITDSDQSSVLPEWKVAALRASTRGRGLVVLGYSGMDEHLNSFIWRGMEESDQSSYPSLWVSPDPLPESVLEKLRGYGGRQLLIEAFPFFKQLDLQS